MNIKSDNPLKALESQTLESPMNTIPQRDHATFRTEHRGTHETYRIRLREERDDAGIFQITSEDSFQRYATHFDPFPSLDVFRTWFAGLGTERFDLVSEVDGELAGFASLFVLPDRQGHSGWFVMGVGEKFQNNGVGRDLLQVLLWIADLVYGLRRVQLMVYSDNAAALALYQRFGFEIEGQHKDFVRYSGQFMDAYSMARVHANAVPPTSDTEINDRLIDLINQRFATNAATTLV